MEKAFIRKETLLTFLCLAFTGLTVFGQTFQRIDYSVGISASEENNAVAFADYDNDNDLDIFIVAKAKDNPEDPKTLSRLYRNNNDGSFTDVTELSGLNELLAEDEGGEAYFGLDGFKNGASWGDYNNDGFPDLFLTYALKVQLWINLGNGTFANVTQGAGFSSVNTCRNTGSTWFDYNNDGLLDIYINDYSGCGNNQLYHNNGNNTFTEVTSTLGLNNTANLASYCAFPFDINSDGFMDLYVSNSEGGANNLYINNNGSSFTDQAEMFGFDFNGNDASISICDYDNNDFFDVLVTDSDNNSFLVNNGDNTFTETADALNLGNSLWARGSTFADFDLDGDEDLFIATGFVTDTRNAEPNFYYRNLTSEGQSIFEDASAALNLNETTVSVTCVDLDYDNDGDLDLLVTNSNGVSFFYENMLLNFDDVTITSNWFKVQLEGTTSNRDAIGAIISLTTTNGTQKSYYSGVGFLSQSLQATHFGLDGADLISELQIQWPSGLVETYNNLDSNITVKAIEGLGIEILNIQPSQKVYGCKDPASCNYNINATVDDGSCTYIPSQAIIGTTNASFLSAETYSYTIGSNSTANWEVVGGEILNGQGTSSINVHWNIEDSGSVAVIESDDQCSSQGVSIDVVLGAANLPDGISIARLWNEALLNAIRGDFARPTVHARNLFHTSVAMYDVWAIYNAEASPYLIGNTVNGFTSTFQNFIPNESEDESLRKAISYAMYRLLMHRFQNSPSQERSVSIFQLVMDALGYDINLTALMYEDGDAAALGNFVAQTIIDYGLQDGSREATGYDNAYYEPVNQAYALDSNDNPPINDPNRWQPLGLDTFIDQGGNIVGDNIPPFLSPEWGNVFGFALSDENMITYQRAGNVYNVFHDPSAPPQISLTENNVDSDAYKWGFSMVSVWQSHLDQNDGVMWDISPNAIGNVDISTFPTDYADYPNFYDFFNGGSNSNGHTLNPVTGNPYEVNMVPRGDYARVLAEFWADGPDSETPPGHWFTILNYVNDHPQFEKRFEGTGEILNDLEWDVKAYFILGGGMHDAAISAWSVKGWYDYIRPISAIRSMAEKGQSTDDTLDNYNVGGIPLIDNYIEIVEEGDPLAGFVNQHVGKIKLFTWRGHDFINNTETDQAGVGWILAEDWYPYQRPTFVTPPFAGYVSGHSTYSRTAAELLTKITGSEFFPGGLGEFTAKANDFLVFEEGPSVDVVLQWATYRDASDQTSLSRIWGGIHPPADDIPGRFIGQVVAQDVFNFAVPYFSNTLSIDEQNSPATIYPNPTENHQIFLTNTDGTERISIYDISGRKIKVSKQVYNELSNTTLIKLPENTDGLYVLQINETSKIIVVKD
ncbi:FG-GAP-like repeat-containing protein [uncultured Winogradskyella sp.]|uniref:FG-GAP-like repeat-containing protein n=1 Tax=uncultured Winogradskyella sp. TaxID=395353 RepID=UPI00262C2520|nr:FG-GAP-like repeat-containing protein [uncultured Winogradskyella sp.]